MAGGPPAGRASKYPGRIHAVYTGQPLMATLSWAEWAGPQPELPWDAEVNLAADFQVPDWFKYTGCRWKAVRTRGGRDHDGMTSYHWDKALDRTGPMEQYRYGEYVPFQANRGTSPGLVCTAQSHLLVVDVDDACDFDLELVKDLVPTVRTSRGFHYHVAVPDCLEPLRPSQGHVRGGDIVSNLWVPAPGSPHPKGGVYTLVGNRINTGTHELLLRLDDARDRYRRAEAKVLAKLRQGRRVDAADAAEIGQDNLLFYVGQSLREQGLTRETAKPQWRAVADGMPLLREGEPWRDSDFERHFRERASSKRKASPAERAALRKADREELLSYL